MSGRRGVSDNDIAFASIEAVARLFRSGKLSPLELAEAQLARIARLNPALNTFLTVTGDLALRQARAAEAALSVRSRRKSGCDLGLLHGIPVSLKDNIETRGVRTTAGAKILENFVPARDAAVVVALQKSGAVLLGKTNMHEFAYGVTTDNPHFGATRNPWDLARTPGGSSGGSAAAVAAGLGYASIGSDTGGSIRIPAALCGVTGLKPGLGRVSCRGVIPLSPSLDCAGPLARSVEDAGIVFDAIAAGGAHGTSRKRLTSLRSVRLGVPREFFFDVLAEDVRACFENAVETCRRLGAQIAEVSIPLLNDTERAGNVIAWAEATRYHQAQRWYPARREEYGDDVAARLDMGAKVLAVDFLAAREERRRFIAQFEGTMKSSRLAALIVPCTPIAAPPIEQTVTRIDGREHPTRALLLRLNRPANLAGVPAISIPCGFAAENLPIGLQLIGAGRSEETLLQVSGALERVLAVPRRVPPAAQHTRKS